MGTIQHDPTEFTKFSPIAVLPWV